MVNEPDCGVGPLGDMTLAFAYRIHCPVIVFADLVRRDERVCQEGVDLAALHFSD